MKNELFINLNSQQQQAVSYINGPSVILAGAGSGKTRVLIYKVIYLVKDLKINPLSIVMVTFTNKAGGEMKERISNIAKIRKLGFVGTFHSFCANILRRHADYLGYSNNFLIYDEDDQLTLIKEIIKEISPEKYTPHYFLSRISEAKNQLIPSGSYLDYFSSFYNLELVNLVYKKYQKRLIKNNAMDFDDLLMNTVFLFQEKKTILENYQQKFLHFLVDEFQDTNHAQFTLIKLLGKKYNNVTVVGDFSQSIYSWRGAEITNLRKFQEAYPQSKIFYLEENYRSTANILDFAFKVISKNTTHPILHLRTSNKEGEEIFFYEAENEEDEAVFVVRTIKSLPFPYSSCAVLYRTNAQSRIIEEAFLHFGVPYVLIGGTRFYERREIKDILAYLKLLINPKDEISLKRVRNLGKKRFEAFKTAFNHLRGELERKTTVELIEEIFSVTDYLSLFHLEDEEDYSRLENLKELKSVALNFPRLLDFLQQVALVESEYFDKEKAAKDKNSVKLMTLHAAKGLEFDVVFIVGVEEGILPHSRSVDDQFQLEEERRLFYVGITRAKKRLYITYAKRRFVFGRGGESIRSRFLDESESF